MAVVKLFETILTMGNTFRTTLNEWYEVSGKMDDLCYQLDCLNEDQQIWWTSITKFGLSDDRELQRILNKLQLDLKKEKIKLLGINDGRLSRCVCKNMRKIKFWLFPAMLQSSINNVTRSFERFNFQLTGSKDFLTGKGNIEKVLRDRVLCAPSNFSFSSDPRYVPLKTEEHVKQALKNSDGPSVILLHGASGTGKSALARNVALYFQTEMKRIPGSNIDVQVSNTYVQPSNPDVETSSKCGITTFQRVIHMECGPKVTLANKQKELVDQLDTSIRNKKTSDVNIEQESSSESDVTKHLSGLLKERPLLIIMDDVWESGFLQEMVCLSGKSVRWLITSQSENLCDNINIIHKHQKIGMENVSDEDARRILAALTGLTDSDIPTMQVVMDSMIKEIKGEFTGANLLALTCVASSIDKKRNKDMKQWKEVRNGLEKVLEAEPKLRIYGKAYGRSYQGAIRFCFEYLSESQKNLLILTSMCKGPSVSSDVIEYLFEQTVAADELFFNTKNELKEKQLLTTKAVKYLAVGEKETYFLHDLLRTFIIKEHLKLLNNSVSIIETLANRKQGIYG